MPSKRKQAGALGIFVQRSFWIEIGRSLYMDERSFERKPFFAQLANDMRDLAATLAAIDPAPLRPA